MRYSLRTPWRTRCKGIFPVDTPRVAGRGFAANASPRFETMVSVGALTITFHVLMVPEPINKRAL